MKWLTATRILIAANFLVLFAMLAHSAYIEGMPLFMGARIGAKFDPELLLQWGSNSGPLTLGGQYWRVITSLFVHLSIGHLLVNMLFLWFLGTHLDRILGRPKTLAIYLLTGVAASLVGMGWHPALNAAGSSGAISGLAGVLLSLFGFAKLGLPRLKIISILAWTLWGTLPVELLWHRLDPGTDYAAHIGGLVSGAIIGGFLAWTFRTSPAERKSRQRRLLVLSTAALVVMFAGVAVWRRDVVEEYREELALHLPSPFSIIHSQRIVSQNPNDAQAHALLGIAYLAHANLDRAAAEYRRALEIQPGDPSYQSTLASLYSIMGRYSDAVALYREILARGPATSDQYAGFATALMATNQLSEAEEEARKAVDLDNKSRNSHQVLSDVLVKLGKTAEAERERKIAEQLPPSK
ncbi:MAG TPA: rhomboid family intramembrane serine protease [Candidatus Angelobacter sp.]|nr:rhomboid family intramembrane serine protease [Candidatus Angelobacter sp.]